MILREIEELHGVLINGRSIKNIKYADYTVLSAETENDLLCIHNKVIEKCESLGLSLNVEKTY